MAFEMNEFVLPLPRYSFNHLVYVLKHLLMKVVYSRFSTLILISKISLAVYCFI